MKTVDLEGPVLEYWFQVATNQWPYDGTISLAEYVDYGGMPEMFGWGDVGPVIERERITLFTGGIERRGYIADWLAIKNADFAAYNGEADTARKTEALGATPLIAAMRCIVLAKLGEDIEP